MWEYVYWWFVVTIGIATTLTLHGYAFDHKDDRLPFILNIVLVVLMQLTIVIFIGILFAVFFAIPQWLFGV